MTTSVESAAREHEILEYSGRKWVTVETAAAYATSERSRVIRELAEKAEEKAEQVALDSQHLSRFQKPRLNWAEVAAWLRSQEVK